MTTTEAPPFDPGTVSAQDVPASDMPPRPSTSSVASDDVPDSGRPPFLGRTRRPPRAAPLRESAPRPTAAFKPRKTDAQLTEALTQLYTFGGMALTPFDQVCGAAVVNSAQPCAESLVKLAQENENVRKALEALTQTSAWGGVVAAHMPLVMAVVGHHFGDKMRGLTDPSSNGSQDEAPTTVRHIGSHGGSVGRFCPTCQGALIRNVKHECPTGA